MMIFLLFALSPPLFFPAPSPPVFFSPLLRDPLPLTRAASPQAQLAMITHRGEQSRASASLPFLSAPPAVRVCGHMHVSQIGTRAVRHASSCEMSGE